jgi:Zn-dependent peptidase ImmA (M78 family)/transcriptional regulator with XRE-family HTH domain
MLRWARGRAGLSEGALAKRFPKLALWELGEVSPTLKQLEAFAAATHTPIGFLFLQEPPVEEVPIPDFRTIAGAPIASPSPDLLETVYICQQRQAWYREHSQAIDTRPLPFVGSAARSTPIERVADEMSGALSFDLDARRRCATWTEALRRLIGQADAMGVMVMCSGVVLNNNQRKLNPREFRGFALCDDVAPLVFINGADTKAAQMFTLAHELAHIWLGESALSDSCTSAMPDHEVERWCNQVAAELLVPLQILRSQLESDIDLDEELARLARRFKVSTLVILRRLYDAGRLSQSEFQEAHDAELRRLLAIPKGTGGQFYLTQAARVSKRFAQALVVDTLEGRTLYRDAMLLLGVKKVETLHGLARSFGLAV